MMSDYRSNMGIGCFLLSILFSLLTWTTALVSHAQEPYTPYLIKDVYPGVDDSDPCELLKIGPTVFFQATDRLHGAELWKTDGTSAGTVMIKDINPGIADSNPNWFVEMGGILYFCATNEAQGRELWKSDGTPAGTVLVKDIFSGASDSDPVPFININGVLYFGAHDSRLKAQLWKSNGSASGTVLVKQFNNFYWSPYAFGARWMSNMNGLLMFVASDGTHGLEPWRSDGTLAGTVMVKDINPGLLDSIHQFSYFTMVGNTLFFNATDGTHGAELWKSDGTADGTIMVKDINPGNNVTPALFQCTTMNEVLFFNVSDNTGYGLWSSDGTAAGTALVLKCPKDKLVGTIRNINNTLFFWVGRNQLWKSNGTPMGTVMIKDFGYDEIMYGWGPDPMPSIGEKVFFTLRDSEHGDELWVSDGTTAGTRITTMNCGTGPDYLTPFGDCLLFSAAMLDAPSYQGVELQGMKIPRRNNVKDWMLYTP